MTQQDHLAAVLRADDDRCFMRSAQRVVEQPPPGGEGQEQPDRQRREPAPEPGIPGSGRVEEPLGLAERRVADQRQQRGGDRAEEDQPRVREGDAAEDVAAQTLRADGRRDRRHADRGDRRHPHPAQQDRHGQGQLDEPQPLPGGHPQPDGRLADSRVDAPQAPGSCS